MTRLMNRIVRCATAIAVVFAAAATANAQTLATYQLGAGWATFGLALPQGAATAGVAVGTLQTQTDVKTRWSDGSIRFAVVTAQVPTAGSYAVTAGPAASGTSTPVTPNASVRLQIGTATYTAVVAPAGSDLWLSGPLVQEWRSVVTPQSASGALHPFLRVIYDTRVYSDGQTRLDVTVENVTDVAGATAVTYDVDILNGSTSLFSKTAVAHYWLTRWRKIFNLGGFVPAAVTPDFEPVFAAKALPRYVTTIVNNVESPTGASYDLLGSGALDPYMPDQGGRPEIAPYPDWTARYIVYRNATQGQFVLANGDLGGSWPVHIRESDGRLVSIDERPNFWLDGRCDNDGISCPRGNLGAIGPLTPEDAHQPSLAYVPYLVTGDRYYADEMAFWANYNLIDVWPPERAGGSGSGSTGSLGLHYYPQPRGFAWALRNLGDAALYLPDTYPNKAYFVAKITNNLKWADDYASGLVTTGYWAQTLSPIGASFYYDNAGQATIAIWEHNYIAWSLDHLIEQGFTQGTKLRDRQVNFQLSLFTSPDFDHNCAAPYRPTIGAMTSLYTTLSQFSVAACADNRQFPAYYGIDARMMLIIAERLGRAGAGSAYDFLMAQVAPDGLTMVTDVNQRAGWSIARTGAADTPPPPPPAPDTTPPVISSMLVSAITDSGATVTWKTDEGSDSQVEFGQTTAYGSTSLFDGALTMSHAVPLSGLLPNTLYHYRVKSRDAAGNLAVSTDQSFTTAPPSTTLKVTFDDLAGSQQALGGQYPAGVIDWGSTQWWLSGPYGAFTSKSVSFNGAATPSMTSASMTMLAGHRVVQIDAFNGGSGSTTVTLKCTGQLNKQVSLAAGQVATIVTGWTGSCSTVTVTSTNGWDTNFDNLLLDASAPVDTTAPIISAVTSSNLTPTGAMITWQTNEAADSQVAYGTGAAYGSQTPLDSQMVTSHAVTLSGLAPATTYHFQVMSKDASGNAATLSDFTFTTLDQPTPPAAPTNLHVVTQ